MDRWQGKATKTRKEIFMDYTALAKQRANGSDILSERTKISTDEIIARYPNGVTINAFDIFDGKNGKYVVCAFNEAPGRYFNGGGILTDIFTGFVNAWETEGRTYPEALSACRDDFAKNSGLKVKLSLGRTKAGNKLTLVEVL